MSLIVADSITQTFGALEVVKNACFRLSENQRIGLVGPNGEGKTTILRILVGELEPTYGSVTRKRNLRIGYLPQDTPTVTDTTLHELMLEVYCDLRAIERELRELAGTLGEDPSNLDRYARLQEQFESRGGYAYIHRIEAVLTGLGFPREKWSRPLRELSGGERTRAQLAKCLLENPDLLLLDEPTNHLDIESVEFLERYLQSYKGAIIVVSHDRYFLDGTTSNTWEIGFGSLEKYRGSYSEYVTKRDERYTERMRQWEAQQEYIEKAEDFIRRNISGQRSREARGRRTHLERFLKIEAIPRPRKHQNIHVRLTPSQRSGDLVMRAVDLTAGYEKRVPLVGIEQLEVRSRQRIAIVGSNGIGKTSLLLTLLGALEPLGGKLQVGTNVRFSYLSQTHEDLRTDATVLETLRSANPAVKLDEGRTLLGSLLFTGDDVFKKVGELSGGQRSRLLIAQLMVQDGNVLGLDEPTNHLDIPSQEVLQEVLQRFDGTVLFVSHDRYLIEALATQIWVIRDGRIKVLPGNWDKYVRWRGESEAENASEDPCPAAGRKASRKDEYRKRRRAQNRLQRLHRRSSELEELIHTTESELEELQEQISHAGKEGDLDRVRELGELYQTKDTDLEELLGEWEQVSEELESERNGKK